MNYLERIDPQDGQQSRQQEGVVLYSFSNNASRLVVIAENDEARVRALQKWETSLQRMFKSSRC